MRRLRRRGVLRRQRLRRVAHLDELVVAPAQRRRRQLQLAVGSGHRRVLALQARVLLLERAQLSEPTPEPTMLTPVPGGAIVGS